MTSGREGQQILHLQEAIHYKCSHLWPSENCLFHHHQSLLVHEYLTKMASLCFHNLPSLQILPLVITTCSKTIKTFLQEIKVPVSRRYKRQMVTLSEVIGKLLQKCFQQLYCHSQKCVMAEENNFKSTVQ
jgi:hypothetical protein